MNDTYPLKLIEYNNESTLTFKEFLMSDKTSLIMFTLDSESESTYFNYSLTLRSSNYTTVTDLSYSVFTAKRQYIKDAFDTENKRAENRFVLRTRTGFKKALKRVKKAIHVTGSGFSPLESLLSVVYTDVIE